MPHIYICMCIISTSFRVKMPLRCSFASYMSAIGVNKWTSHDKISHRVNSQLYVNNEFPLALYGRLFLTHCMLELEKDLCVKCIHHGTRMYTLVSSKNTHEVRLITSFKCRLAFAPKSSWDPSIYIQIFRALRILFCSTFETFNTSRFFSTASTSRVWELKWICFSSFVSLFHFDIGVVGEIMRWGGKCSRLMSVCRCGKISHWKCFNVRRRDVEIKMLLGQDLKLECEWRVEGSWFSFKIIENKIDWLINNF